MTDREVDAGLFIAGLIGAIFMALAAVALKFFTEEREGEQNGDE